MPEAFPQGRCARGALCPCERAGPDSGDFLRESPRVLQGSSSPLGLVSPALEISRAGSPGRSGPAATEQRRCARTSRAMGEGGRRRKQQRLACVELLQRWEIQLFNRNTALCPRTPRCP